MFFKIGVLKNFANFKGKHLCWILFLIISPATLFKKRLKHGCFPVKLAKFLRTPFFLQNTSGGGFWSKKENGPILKWMKKEAEITLRIALIFPRNENDLSSRWHCISTNCLFCWIFLTRTRLFYIRKRFIRNSNQIGLSTQETNVVSLFFLESSKNNLYALWKWRVVVFFYYKDKTFVSIR